MGTILVRYKNSRYRLWDTVCDVWLSPIMNFEKTVEFLMNDPYEAATQDEAFNRIHRIGYDSDHLEYLRKYFDSRISNLTCRHNIHSKKKG